MHGYEIMNECLFCACCFLSVSGDFFRDGMAIWLPWKPQQRHDGKHLNEQSSDLRLLLEPLQFKQCLNFLIGIFNLFYQLQIQSYTGYGEFFLFYVNYGL